MAFSILFCFTGMTSSAADNISIDEFEAMMNELYKKYDWEFEIVDNNGYEYVSKEYAAAMYQKALNYFEEEQEDHFEVVSSTPAKSDPSNTLSVNRVMPVSYYEEEYFLLSGSPTISGSASFRVACSGTVNAQYNTFMSLSYTGVRQIGAAVNYAGYEVISDTGRYQNNNTEYRVDFTVEVTFAYTQPQTGILLSETRDFTRNYTFKAANGI